jgi:hypothetical protein
MKNKIGSFFADRIAIVATVIGFMLMAVALHYNVNPVEGGAIRGGLQNHPVLLWVLAIATIPAMMLAMILTGLFMKMPDWAPVFLPVVFVCQTVLSFLSGKIVSILICLIRKIGTKGSPQPGQSG